MYWSILSRLEAYELIATMFLMLNVGLLSFSLLIQNNKIRQLSTKL